MTTNEFWTNVLAHFVAIVLGGLKLAIFSGIFWYVFRKKYMAKFMGKLMQDLMAQLNPPVPADHGFVSAVASVLPDPISGFGAGLDSHGLLKDHVPLSLEELRPYMAELELRNPQTQAEILEIAGKHGYCWDSFGRLIRKPVVQEPRT